MANKYRFKTVSLPIKLHSRIEALAKKHKRSIPKEIEVFFEHSISGIEAELGLTQMEA